MNSKRMYPLQAIGICPIFLKRSDSFLPFERDFLIHWRDCIHGNRCQEGGLPCLGGLVRG
jgi:hypothetical protein